MLYVRMLCLLAGSVASVLYIIFMLKGGRYASLGDSQPKEQFSNGELCSVGFAMQDVPFLALRGSMGKAMRTQAELLYGRTYAEFYARLFYARGISMTWLIAAIMLCVTAAFPSDMTVYLVGATIIASAAIWYDQMNGMKKVLDQRSEACIQEFPNVISKLALLVNSGMILNQAWDQVANSKEGEIYTLMTRASQEVENGVATADAFYRFGVLSNNREIRKFSGMLMQSLEKGGAELTGFLMNQSAELWSQKKQRALQSGDKAAAKLLIPTMLMLAGIMLIILSAVAQSLSF